MQIHFVHHTINLASHGPIRVCLLFHFSSSRNCAIALEIYFHVTYKKSLFYHKLQNNCSFVWIIFTQGLYPFYKSLKMANSLCLHRMIYYTIQMKSIAMFGYRQLSYRLF